MLLIFKVKNEGKIFLSSKIFKRRKIKKKKLFKNPRERERWDECIVD